MPQIHTSNFLKAWPIIDTSKAIKHAMMTQRQLKVPQTNEETDEQNCFLSPYSHNKQTVYSSLQRKPPV